MSVPLEKKEHLRRGVWIKEPTPLPTMNSLKAVLEVVEEVLQVGDPQVKDPQEVKVMMSDEEKMRIEIKREEDFEDEYMKVKTCSWTDPCSDR